MGRPAGVRFAKSSGRSDAGLSREPAIGYGTVTIHSFGCCGCVVVQGKGFELRGTDCLPSDCLNCCGAANQLWARSGRPRHGEEVPPRVLSAAMAAILGFDAPFPYDPSLRYPSDPAMGMDNETAQIHSGARHCSGGCSDRMAARSAGAAARAAGCRGRHRGSAGLGLWPHSARGLAKPATSRAGT